MLGTAFVRCRALATRPCVSSLIYPRTRPDLRCRRLLGWSTPRRSRCHCSCASLRLALSTPLRCFITTPSTCWPVAVASRPCASPRCSACRCRGGSVSLEHTAVCEATGGVRRLRSERRRDSNHKSSSVYAFFSLHRVPSMHDGRCFTAAIRITPREKCAIV